MVGMLEGPIVRTRKNHKLYKKYSAARKSDCDFCDLTAASPQTVKEYDRFWVIRNIFKYDIWDSVPVLEHLMVLPKRHVDSLSRLNKAEAAEWLGIVQEYEAAGYSLYSRAPQDITKSIPHQHTHLLKLGTKRAKALIYLKTPHILKYI